VIDFLNLSSDEKSTLAGSEFQTITTRSVTNSFGDVVLDFHTVLLYSLYGCPLVEWMPYRKFSICTKLYDASQHASGFDVCRPHMLLYRRQITGTSVLSENYPASRYHLHITWLLPR